MSFFNSSTFSGTESSFVRKIIFVLAFSFTLPVISHAQLVARPSEPECPDGWEFDGVECCPIGDVCNPGGPSVPAGGQKTPGTPTAGGSGERPQGTDICDWVRGPLAKALGCDQ